MSALETLAAIGATLIACFISAIWLLGFDATYTFSVPVIAALTALAAIILGYLAWFGKMVPDRWRLAAVPWAMFCGLFAFPILMAAPFAYLILFITGSIRSRPRRTGPNEDV